MEQAPSRQDGIHQPQDEMQRRMPTLAHDDVPPSQGTHGNDQRERQDMEIPAEDVNDAPRYPRRIRQQPSALTYATLGEPVHPHTVESVRGSNESITQVPSSPSGQLPLNLNYVPAQPQLLYPYRLPVLPDGYGHSPDPQVPLQMQYPQYENSYRGLEPSQGYHQYLFPNHSLNVLNSQQAYQPNVM